MTEMSHTEFVSHKVCWLFRYDIILSHAVGDALITIAYFLIPIMLFHIVRTYQLDWRVRFIFFVYGAFILLCGMTHLFNFIMIWHISEAFLMWDGALRIITGVFSMFSAGVTFYLVMKFWELSGKVITLVHKMKAERQNDKRVSDATWNDLMDLVSRAKQIVAPRNLTKEPG